MLNPNHPKTGSQIKVDPIKNLKDIKSIKKLLKDNPRDFALFVMGDQYEFASQRSGEYHCSTGSRFKAWR